MSIRKVRTGFCMAAVIFPAWMAQAGTSTGTSPVFTVDLQALAGGLTVNGRVLDAATRQPLSSVSVSLAGRNGTTGSDGNYSLANVALSSGSTLSASKSGYVTYSGAALVPLGCGSVATQPDILLGMNAGSVLVVTGLKPKYEGIFISGASLLNEYTATVNWSNRTPSRVDFYVNGSWRDSIPTTTTEATANINMGLGFVGSLNLGANKVRVIAVDSLGTQSPPFDQSVTIIPMPLFLADQAILLPFEFIPGNKPAISWEFNFPRSLGSARDVQQIPFIGNFGPDFSFNIAFDYDLLTGEWGLFAGKEWDKRLRYRAGQRPHSTPLSPKFYLGNVDFNYEFGGKAEGVASQTRGIVIERVGVQLSAGVRMEILTFYFTDYVPGGQIVRLLDSLKNVGIDVNSIQRVRVFGLFDASFSAMFKFPSLEFDNAMLNLKPGVEALYEPDLVVAHASIAVGGSLGFDLQLAPVFGLDEVKAAIYLKLHFEAWLLEPYDETFLILNGTVYDRAGSSPRMRMAKAGQAKPLLGSSQWLVYQAQSSRSGVVKRDYLNGGGEQFVAGPNGSQAKLTTSGGMTALDAFRTISKTPPRSAAGLGQTVQSEGDGPQPKGDPQPKDGIKSLAQADLSICTNVFPSSQPAMDGRGQDLMLLYVADNGISNSLQFTDIKWTRWDGTNWSVPAGIQTNTQAEFAPAVRYDTNGDTIAVWERVADPNFNQTNLGAMAAQMEIAWSKWSRTSRQWSVPGTLTANTYLDHAPLLCGPMADGSLLTVWTKNDSNLLMGTNGAGSQVLWRQWNPASQSWSGAQTLVADLPYRLSQSLAGVSNRAVYAWTRDLDGALTNDNDQEVFYCEWTNGVWSAVRQFTTNTVADKNARAAVSPTGDAYVVWQQGTNLVMNKNFSTNTSLVRMDSQTAGFADYALAFGPAGNLVLIWQEMSTSGSDAHYMVYDPASGTWSKDMLLFQDPPLERSFAPVWDNVGNLTLAYNKVDIFYTNMTVMLTNNQTLTITNVPQPGRVDLCVTKRALIKDLALLAGDFTAQGNNYLPGDAVTLSATVRNAGDVAITNVVLSFYDGNPDSGGTLITNVTLSGWLEGAGTNLASALWVVPDPATNHTLYAVVDRAGAVTEFNETNNTQWLKIGGTDLAVTVVSSQPETNGALRVWVQVQNLGAPGATNSVLAIRRAGETNAPLATVAVPLLDPGRLAQVALDLPAGTQPEGEALYTLHADDTAVVTDVDTNNNTTTFAVNLWVDTDGDGIPDNWMMQYFGHATGQAGDLSRAQDDADGDGASNLAEYLAGTNPRDSHSYLRITGLGVGGTNGVQIAWGSASNKLYSVQRATGLNGGSGFTNIAGQILSTPPENVYLDATATNSPSLFYRVRVE